MTNPANSTTLTETFWQGVGTPTSYSVRVTLSNLSTACGGIGFGDGYRAYTGYVCSSGTWYVTRYDSTGAPNQVGTGSIALQRSQLIEVTVASNSTVEFHVGATTVFTGSIANGYDTREIELTLYGYTGQTGQGYFSDFVYGRD
jgi:hypothetical protein